MTYADYEFYISVFQGEDFQGQSAQKWLECASDELDALTFGRLGSAFPTVPAHAEKVKKAVCAIAEILSRVDAAQKAAALTSYPDGSVHGAVLSVSSGRESVSYQSAAQAASSSSYVAAAADHAKLSALIRAEAAKYIANIPDSRGVNLLYAGG